MADGKALGGAGRLTHSRIDTMQGFYGKAIRDNKDDAKGMAKATHAILKHYSSTEEDPRHEDCPAGSNSWCSFQRDVANGTNLHQPIENPFPDAVVEVMQPLFNRLGDETFLVGCEKCYTQNQNESLHHVIWGMAAKEMYSSPQEISIAISLGVLHFNQGYEKTYCSLLPSLGVEVTPEMVEAWQRIDGARLYQASYKNLPSTKLRRKKKRNAKLKKIDAFRRTEGPDMYKSQAYHGGYKSGKQPRKGNKKGKKSAKKK